MTTMRGRLAVLLLAGVVASLAPDALAACRVCPRAHAACRAAANHAHVACRAVCRSEHGGDSCVAACDDAREAARGSCEDDRARCLASCDAESDPCAATCTDSLGACRKLVYDDGRACRHACVELDDRDARRACLLACRVEQAHGGRSCARQAVACAVGCVPLATCTSADLEDAALAACSAYCGTLACVRSGDGLCGAARELLRRASGGSALPCDCALDPSAELPPPPAPEPIELDTVPLPDHVTSVRFPWYGVDGSRILAGASSPLFVRASEIVRVAEDGSDFACLTCASSLPGDPALRKPFPFPDGRRVMLRVGMQSPLVAAEHAILECTPSVLDCQAGIVVPIDVPGAGLPQVTQVAREFRVAPDDVHVAFTQIRRRTDGGEVPLMVVGELVREPDRYTIAGARVVGTDGELKEFTRDNQSFLFLSASTEHSFNFDDYRRDLATGATSRVTTHPDYDEAIDQSPDGEWYVVGSGRTLGRWERFSQVKRPAIVDRALSQRLLSWFLLAGEGGIGEPWLIDRHGERGTYIGRRVNEGAELEGGNGRAIPNWHPDGTRIVFWETIDPAFRAPGDADSRVRVARLTSRRPVASPLVARPMPDVSWAPLLDGFLPPPDPALPETLAGRVGGEARVVLTPGAPSRLEVTYDGFTDDGLNVLSGSESVLFDPGNLLLAARWDADVTLSGCHAGFLRAEDLEISPLGLTGSLVSEVDGRRFEGLP